MPKQGGLGRGLASLIPDKKQEKNQKVTEQAQEFWGGKNETSESSGDGTKSIPVTRASKAETDSLPSVPASSVQVSDIAIADIEVNPYQPRTHFDHTALEELISSVKEHGILQPLVVAPHDGKYQLIAGERRLRAATFLEFETVPAIIREVTEQQQLELSLIENIQRQQLNPIEEALSYKRLLDEFNLHQEDIAQRVGKSRSKIANTLRLLQLPEEIQQWLSEGKLTEGHAKVLLELDNPKKQVVIAKKIMRQSLTVRDASATVKEAKGVAVKGHIRKAADPRLKSYEKTLQSVLGTKVKIDDTSGKGRVVVEYFSDEELDSLIERIKQLDDLL